MTCNPNWVEITNNLRFNEEASNRVDLTVRVSNMKLTVVLDDIYKKGIFGTVVANIHVIEFQKRGLSHAHILILLERQCKFRSTDDYDNIVCAEIPDPIRQPRLCSIVTNCMIHGPCGDPVHKRACEKATQSVDGKCRFKYPKKLQETTSDSSDSFPSYRGRNGRMHQKGLGESATFINNSWISPYSPYLTLKYNCHINVEICSSIFAAKYLDKYVYKGHDMTMIRLQRHDDNNNGAIPPPTNEIQQFSSARYYLSSLWPTKVHA